MRERGEPRSRRARGIERRRKKRRRSDTILTERGRRAKAPQARVCQELIDDPAKAVREFNKGLEESLGPYMDAQDFGVRIDDRVCPHYWPRR